MHLNQWLQFFPTPPGTFGRKEIEESFSKKLAAASGGAVGQR
jgi:hypothetical protein